MGLKVSLDTLDRRKPSCLARELKHDSLVVQPYNLVNVLTVLSQLLFSCAWDSISVAERLVKFMTVGLIVTVDDSCIFNVEC